MAAIHAIASPKRGERKGAPNVPLFSPEHPLSSGSDVVLVTSDLSELHVHKVTAPLAGCSACLLPHRALPAIAQHAAGPAPGPSAIQGGSTPPCGRHQQPQRPPWAVA